MCSPLPTVTVEVTNSGRLLKFLEIARDFVRVRQRTLSASSRTSRSSLGSKMRNCSGALMRSASKNTQSKGPGRVMTISVAEPSCTVIISLRPALAMFSRACCTLRASCSIVNNR